MDDIGKKARQYFKDSLKRKDENLQEAVVLIQKAIDLAPQISIYYAAKAQYQNDMDKYDEALVSIEKAIELEPKNFFAWGIKGLIKENMEKYQEAAEAYAESLKIKPDFNTYTLLSSVQLEFDPKKAIQSAKKALELNSNWGEAKNLLKEAQDKVKKEKN